MPGVRWGLVDIVRDFLTSYQVMMRVGDRYRRGSLRFSEIESFVGQGEHCVLFRLKERCHALYREQPGGDSSAMRREALLDLAVGSLFHEAMKFRENLYQQEVYAPKVRRLRDEAHEEAGEFLLEFERILAVSATRLNEALLETEALFEQTRKQLTGLLVDDGDEGLVTRCLLERESQVNEVFPQGLNALLTEIHGDVGTGYRIAAESYLRSAHFEEAVRVLEGARANAGEREDLVRLSLFAEGMQAFQTGSHEQSLGHLEAWLEAGGGAGEASYAGFARAAVSRIVELSGRRSSPAVVEAEALAERLAALMEPPE